jgi:hypothetical protein
VNASEPSEPGPARWGQLAELLAGMPDVVQRLIVEHVPDAKNRCRGCTLPGTGSPNEPWPCPLRKLAEQARRLQPGAMQNGTVGPWTSVRGLRLAGRVAPLSTAARCRERTTV